MLPFPRLLSLVAALVLVAAAGAACGGDDDPAGNATLLTPTIIRQGTGTPGPAPTLGPQDPVQLKAWADGYCKTLLAYGAAVEKVKPAPGADTSVDELRNIMIGNAKVLAEAADTALRGLTPLAPPPAAVAYHEAALRSMRDLAQFSEVAQRRLANATTASELDAVLAEQRINLRPSQEAAARVASEASPQVREAVSAGACLPVTPTATPQ
jgi:hypothetical protein